jgi:hypothetical protein
MKDQRLPGHHYTNFHPCFQAQITTENMIHRLGAWLKLNKSTIQASVQHQAKGTGRTPLSPHRHNNRLAPTCTRASARPLYRQLTLHTALEQCILNQCTAQNRVPVPECNRWKHRPRCPPALRGSKPTPRVLTTPHPTRAARMMKAVMEQ